MANKYTESLKNFKLHIEEEVRLHIKEEVELSLDENFNIKDENEKECSLHWIENIKLYHNDYSLINEGIYFFKYEYTGSEEKYIDKIGNYIIYMSSNDINDDILLSEFVEVVEFNRGILLSMFLNPEYYIGISYNLRMKYEILNILDLNDENYRHHEFREIIKILDNIKVFKIKEKHLNQNQDLDDLERFKFRFLGILRSTNILNGSIKMKYFSECSILLYSEIFKSDIVKLPYENIYFSLNHNSPKYIFLEIYKLYEKLYPIICCKQVKEEFGINGKDIIEISTLLKQQLSWRHDEKKSLNSIFKYSEELNLDNYLDSLKEYKNRNTNYHNNTIGTWIYEIRNELVHLSFKIRDSKLDVNDVLKNDKLINNLLNIIYRVYQNIFN